MPENRRARLRAALLHLLITMAAGALLTLALLAMIRAAETRAIERLVRAEAGLIAGNPDLLAAWEERGDDLPELLGRWAELTQGQLAAFDTDGSLVASSLAVGGNRLPGPEVWQAQQTGYGRNTRRDGSADETTLFVALPLRDESGTTLGVLRWSAPLDSLRPEMTQLQWQVALLILGAALVTAGMLIWQRERNARVLRRLYTMIDQALDLDFEGHVLTTTADELGQLTGATNRLVDKYRKATKRRAREKDRLNTLLAHMASGALILNESGSVRLINPAALSLLRTTEERAVRQSFVQVVWDHRVAEVWQRCVRSGVEESESIELSPDRFVRVTVTPFLGGSASGYLVILENLTPQRQLERMRRDFVSNVSHDLRTPLASMGALVDTLRDDALDDPPAARRFVDRMGIEVEKMTQMVEELLELSRIESGRLPLRLTSTPVAQIVSPALERMAMQAERSGVMLHAEVEAGLPSVLVDGERLQQVLINLLHNALKFTPAGGQVTVRAALNPDDPATITMSVADTGAGIPTEDQPRIFERFYKADRSRSSGGTGLGLAIAKHTVQAHGGRIWVESREGEGSTFYFTLPAETPAVETAALAHE